MARGAAVGAAAALLALSAAPAVAVTPVAQASGRAINVEVAGQGTGVEGFTSTHDGTSESTFGSNQPAVRLLGGQDLASVGTLAQDATTSVDGSTGVAAACSGLAGDGASLVQAGDGDCLTGGNNLQLEIATLDLSDLHVVGGEITNGFPNLQEELEKGGLSLKAVTDPLSDGLQSLLTQLGSPGLYLDLDAITSQCVAHGREVSGSSRLAGASLYLQLPQGAVPGESSRVDLVQLPLDPAPNTELVTGLDEVTELLVDGLRHQLSEALGGELADADVALDQLEPVLTEVTEQLSSQLGPVEDNLLRATLNAQTKADGQISVTALDLRLLPAAAEFVGSDLVHVQVATSGCGPNGRVAADTPAPQAEAPAPVQPVAHTPPAKNIPTVVTAGMETAPDDGVPAGTSALVALLLLGSAGAGVAVYRRTLHG